MREKEKDRGRERERERKRERERERISTKSSPGSRLVRYIPPLLHPSTLDEQEDDCKQQALTHSLHRARAAAPVLLPLLLVLLRVGPVARNGSFLVWIHPHFSRSER